MGSLRGTMRLVSTLCSLLLVAGPAFAQQLELTPVKLDCSPDEPDSLEISWNGPCDMGDLLFDTEKGCRMWDLHPEPEDKAVWMGACRAGLPEGRSEAQWMEHGRPADRFVGTYQIGKREGPGHYTWNDSVSFKGSYANDVPQGRGTLRIDDTVLSGEWNKGCLATTGKMAAIGVPRASCGPAGKPSRRWRIAEGGTDELRGPRSREPSAIWRMLLSMGLPALNWSFPTRNGLSICRLCVHSRRFCR